MWMLQKIVVGKQGYSVYNNMMVKITAGPNDAHRRLDRFLRQYFDKAPLSLIYKMIRKDVKVNGKRQSRETLLEEGDEICVYMTEEQADALRSTRRTWHVRKQFRVLYEDDQVLFTGKPFGLLTHGDRHEKKNTLVNQVEGYLMEKGDFVPDRENHFRPAAVNRLDRNTTGIVVFGKTQEALRTYTALMRDKEAVDKEYLAIVHHMAEQAGIPMDDPVEFDKAAVRWSMEQKGFSGRTARQFILHCQQNQDAKNS